MSKKRKCLTTIVATIMVGCALWMFWFTPIRYISRLLGVELPSDSKLIDVVDADYGSTYYVQMTPEELLKIADLLGAEKDNVGARKFIPEIGRNYIPEKAGHCLIHAGKSSKNRWRIVFVSDSGMMVLLVFDGR